MAIDPNGLVRLQRVVRAARLRGWRSLPGASGRQGLAAAGEYLRDYAPGDDYRAVDWYLCARHDELRVAAAPRRSVQAVYVLIDASTSMTVGPRPKRCVARRAVALLGALALATGSSASAGETKRLCAATYSNRILRRSPPLEDLASWVAWLAEAEGAASREADDFDRVARQFLKTRPLRASVCVVTDAFESDGLVAGLALLKTHGCRPHLVHVVDPADREPQFAGDVELVDVETGRRRATTLTPRDLALFRREYDAWLGRVRTACRRLQIDVGTVSVADDFGALVWSIERLGVA
jgi:uncharacterized protein (DUF58 family)